MPVPIKSSILASTIAFITIWLELNCSNNDVGNVRMCELRKKEERKRQAHFTLLFVCLFAYNVIIIMQQQLCIECLDRFDRR